MIAGPLDRCSPPRTSRRAGSAAVLLAFAASAPLWFAVASGQHALPPQLKIPMEEAQVQYFDGEYANALRQVEKLDAWFKEPANKKLLDDLGLDHTVQRAMVLAIKAEILAALDRGTAVRGAIDDSRGLIQNRRAFYLTTQGAVFRDFFRIEALLEFIEADSAKPMPDFGLLDLADVPKEIRSAYQARTNRFKAEKALQRCEALINQFLAGSTDDETNRLKARRYICLAEQVLRKVGGPEPAELIDVRAYLRSARDLLSSGALWKLIIDPDSPLPLRFKDIATTKFLEKLPASDRPGGRPAGGEKERPLTREEELLLKQWYSQSIRDWLMLSMAETELATHDGGDRPETDSAEVRFGKMLGYLRAQYRGSHPLCVGVMLQRARWYLRLARLAAGQQDPQAAGKARNLLQDSLFETDRLRGCVGLSPAQERECNFLEFSALGQMLALDAKAKFLDRQGQQELRERRDVVGQALTKKK